MYFYMLGQTPFSRKITDDQVDKALTPQIKVSETLLHYIIDNFIGHLTGRFLSLELLRYFNLLNLRKFETLSQMKHFP